MTPDAPAALRRAGPRDREEQAQATDSVFVFGRCELNTGTRELRRDGEVRAVEPLAFDLLVYLLRHHERDVTKDELLDEVWLGRLVSIGALARAMLTVRKAIGDDGAPPLIRTVHRVGYRFAGDVAERPLQPAAPAPAEDAPRVVALLPFENLTGELSLDWATIGLMALVGNALALDRRLAPLSVHAVAEALQGLPRDADAAARAAALQHRGARSIVQTRIFRDGEGYRLDWALWRGPDGASGCVHASDLVRLGRALARRLVTHLLPGAAPAVDGFRLHDAWAMLVFAHAMQASADGAWIRARLMLRVVLDLEPDYAEARRELERIEPLAQAQEPSREPCAGIGPRS